MRLIDADALKIPRYTDEVQDLFIQGYRNGKTDAITEITALAPTIDAVPVVRCKDCKHLAIIENSCPYCTWHYSGCAYNDYCSYGERKDGETDG